VDRQNLSRPGELSGKTQAAQNEKVLQSYVGTSTEESNTEEPKSQEVSIEKAAAKWEKKAKKYFRGFAHPISENGTVLTSQIYQEAVHQMFNIDGSAFKILMFIIRQTIGWRKLFDWITLNQLEHGIINKGKVYFRGVGLSRKPIVKGLQELQDNGYITKRVICPWCVTDVRQIPKPVKMKSGETITRMQVEARCPHCQGELRGKEKVYYGPRFRVVEKLPKGSVQKGLGVVEKVHSQESKQEEEPIINDDDDVFNKKADEDKVKDMQDRIAKQREPLKTVVDSPSPRSEAPPPLDKKRLYDDDESLARVLENAERSLREIKKGGMQVAPEGVRSRER
jgi:hypothetical protein|tara:strand:- start:3166 stop:4179 length:1014 start_codon:yes stop_codon:yes gene_type:complete